MATPINTVITDEIPNMFGNMATGGGGASKGGNTFAGFNDNDPLLAGDDSPVADPVESVKQQLIAGMITPAQARELLISFNYPNADALIRSWSDEMGMPVGMGMDMPDDPLLGATQFDDGMVGGGNVPVVTTPVVDDGIGDPLLMGDGMGNGIAGGGVVGGGGMGMGGGIGTPGQPGFGIAGGAGIVDGGGVVGGGGMGMGGGIGTPGQPGFGAAGGVGVVGGGGMGSNVVANNIANNVAANNMTNNLLADQMGDTSTAAANWIDQNTFDPVTGQTLWETSLNPLERYRQRMLSGFQDAPIGAELAARNAVGYGFNPLYAQMELAQAAGAYTPELGTGADLGTGQAFMNFLDRREQGKVGDIRQQYGQLSSALSSLAGGKLAPGSAGYIGGYGAYLPDERAESRQKILAASQAALGLRGKMGSGLGSIYDVMERRYGVGGRGKFSDWVSGAFGERGLAKRQAEEQAANPFISFDGNSPELNF